MPRFLSDILAILVALIPLVVSAERPGDGPTKRAEVLAEINRVLDEPGGIDWPKWLPGQLRPWLLGLFIDLLIRLLNRSGFFGA